MKKYFCTAMCAVLLCLMLFGCGKAEKTYLQEINGYSFWENDLSTAVPEYRTYDHVHAFLDEGTLQNGDMVSKDGKVRKVLFLGFDGMRADALTNVLFDENTFDTNGYNAQPPYSGIREIQKTGGVYIAYCGGEKGTDTQQSTSTSASWTSHFTGVWGVKHGIRENEDSKNLDYKTFMLEYAEQGLQTSIAFDWEQYFDINLKEEVRYVSEHPELEMRFCDIDRAKADALPQDALTDDLTLYNFIAAETPSQKEPYDEGMRDYVLERIKAGDDIVVGIFHNIDSNGHTYTFSNETQQYVNSVRTCDLYAYDIVQAIAERERTQNEEWLIIMANDHGGTGQGHGEQSAQERTTWIATNRKLDTAWYSVGYDGYNVQQGG